MTTFYALPTLTSWNGTPGEGWSYSSGGSDSLTCPGPTDDVIFDANSGSARTIQLQTTTVRCRTLKMITCANMNFNAGTDSSLQIGGGISDLTKLTACYAQLTVSEVLGQGTTILNSGSCIFYGGFNMQSDLTLAGDLNVPGNFVGYVRYDANSNQIPMALDFAGHNVTVGSISLGGSVFTVKLGGGTLILTALGKFPGEYLFSSSSILLAQGGTIKIQIDPSKTISSNPYIVSVYGTDTSLNVWVARAIVAGIRLTINNSFNNLRVDAGNSVSLESYITANSFSFFGTSASQISIAGYNGSTMSMTLNGSTRQYMDYVNFSYINFGPTNVFYGRACTFQSCTGQVVYKAPPSFLNFM